MHEKCRLYTLAWWLWLAALAVAAGCFEVARPSLLSALAAESQPLMAQVEASQSGDGSKSEGETAVTRGMGKEAVRAVWGDPAEIRRIRTCFGWQEEWTYRGDPRRFGVDERILLFDEGEVLTEIK